MQLCKLTNKLLFLLLERKQVGANLKHSTMYFLPSFEYSGEKWWYASFPLWHQNLICSVCVCQCQMDGWMKTQMGTNLLSQKVRQRERKIECDAFICLLYFKFQSTAGNIGTLVFMKSLGFRERSPLLLLLHTQQGTQASQQVLVFHFARPLQPKPFLWCFLVLHSSHQLVSWRAAVTLCSPRSRDWH